MGGVLIELFLMEAFTHSRDFTDKFYIRVLAAVGYGYVHNLLNKIF